MSEDAAVWQLDLPTTERPERIRFLVNEYSSFSNSGSFHLGEAEIDSRIPWLRPIHRNLHLPRQRRPGELTSSLFGALAIPGQEPITVGVLGPQAHFAQVRVSPRPGSIRLWVQLQLEGGKPAGKPPEIFVERGPVWRALDRYARAWGMEPRAVPAGWCSWYHYYTRIDERACHRNLELAPRFPVQVFQLDDGYQRDLGDWLTPNAKFPSGLADLARRARDAGMVPGLWLAPFLARKGHEWVLRDARGRPVKALWNPAWGAFRFAYALDPTHPGLRKHLRELFSTLREQGFGFFKLDFLFAGALPGVRHGPAVTSLEALRGGLQAIRDAVGDAYLLGCGCPLEAGIGLVDSMRVGNDVTPAWSTWIDRWIGRGFEQLSTRNCLRNTLVRAPLNGRLFHSDPDCLLTQGLTPTEQRTLAQVNALSGGTLMISDDLSALTPERRAVVDFAFQLSREVRAGGPRTFAAPDLMERRIPELQLALGAEDALLGVYNFGGRPAAKTVRLRELVPWPRFTVNGSEAGDSISTEEIEPHGARLFRIRASSQETTSAMTDAR
ncbi:MAG TPA: glycoside hydrolase family 36 protein [Myxococcaceae bacterium]